MITKKGDVVIDNAGVRVECNETHVNPSGRLKKRYILAAIIVLLSIVITPFCIETITQVRGYEAFGGEYFIIPFGLVIALIAVLAAKEVKGA